MLWIIYLVLVGVVALFFTLFINQGLAGMFSAKDAQGKISTFNSYLFLDFNKISNTRKANYDRAVTGMEKFTKKLEEYTAAQNGIKTIGEMLKALKGNAEAKATAAAFAAEIRKKLNNTTIDNETALNTERENLKKVVIEYERNKSKFETEMFGVKKPVDLFRIENLIASLAYKKVKSGGEIPQNQMNIIPPSTMNFIVINLNIEKKFPESLKLAIIPEFNDAMVDEINAVTEESVKKEMAEIQKNIQNIKKKMKTDGETPELKEQLKNAEASIKPILEKMQKKKILDTIVSTFTEEVDKAADYFKQYATEVAAHVEAEEMPFPNFLTQGVYLGKYALAFPQYGNIVKTQLVKNIMPLSGLHRVEERLFGNRAQITNYISRKIFGVGEVLTYRLASTELDFFTNAFKALNHAVKLQLEQSVSFAGTVEGTTGGGGQVELPAVNLGAPQAQPAPEGEQQQQPSAAPAASQPETSGELNAAEKKIVLTLYKRFDGYFENIKSFFAATAQVVVTASIIKRVDRTLNRIYAIMKELKEKYPKILAQTPIDTSESGGGQQLNIQEKFDTAFGKLSEIQKFIEQKMTKLTSITSAGSTVKLILTIIFGIIGACLALFTFIWDKQEKANA